MGRPFPAAKDRASTAPRYRNVTRPLALALPADPQRNGPPKTPPFDIQELRDNLNFLIKVLPQPPSGSNSCCEVVNF